MKPNFKEWAEKNKLHISNGYLMLGNRNLSYKDLEDLYVEGFEMGFEAGQNLQKSIQKNGPHFTQAMLQRQNRE